MTTTTYEVTVPVTVTVTCTAKKERVTIVGAVVDEGYPGFFSQAQECMGTWNVAEQEWDGEAPLAVALAAHRHVHAAIDSTTYYEELRTS